MTRRPSSAAPPVGQRPQTRHARAPDDGTARCFIALPLPDDVKACCASAIDALSPHVPKVRWVKPDQMHLTLKFLGNVARALIPELRAAVCAAVGGREPFTLQTGGISQFGSVRRPRVLWLGVQGDVDALAAVHARVERACESVHLAKDDRPYHPHLTLGRVRSGAVRYARDWLDRVAPPPATSWRADAVHLYESRLGSEGATHTVIAVCSLCDE